MDDFSNQGEQVKQKSQNITSSSDQREKWKLRQNENRVSFKPNFVTSSNNQPGSSKLNDVSTHLTDSSTPNAVKKEPRCRVNTEKQPANSDDPIGKGVSTKFDTTRENNSNDGKPSDNSNVKFLIQTNDMKTSDTESKSIKMRKQIIYNDFSEQVEGHNSHVQHADELTAYTESPDQYSKNTETVYLKQHSPGQNRHSVNKLHSSLPKQHNTHGRIKENFLSRQSMAGSAEPVTCSHHLHGICQCCYGPFPEVKCINCGSFHIHRVRCCRCQEILFQCGDCMQVITSGENASSSHERKPVRKNKNAHVKESSKDNENSKSNQTGGVTQGETKIGTTNPIKKNSPSTVYYEGANNMSEMVAKEGLIVKDVHPDGNCLFTAVVDQLRVRGEFFYTAKTLRAAAVSYLREHPSQHDGTPLSHFLTGSDTTWEGYLERMSHGGEWGDHIIISAIASILSRRLVILNGRFTLHRNIVEPIQSQPPLSGSSEHPDTSAVPQDQLRESISSDSDQGVQTGVSSKGSNPSAETSVSGDNGEVENVNRSGIPRYDDLYLGHIAEAHYFSLRHNDWETRLYECLKTKTTSCFLQYGLETETKTRTDYNEDSGNQTKFALHPNFPEIHLNFFLKYIRRVNLIPAIEIYLQSGNDNGYFSYAFVGDSFLGLTSMYTSEHTKQTQKICKKLIKFVTLNDTEVVFDDYTEMDPKDLIADDTCSHVGFTRLIPVTPFIWMQSTIEENGKKFLKQLFMNERRNDFIAFRCDWPSVADEWITRPRMHGWPPAELRGHIVENGVKVISQCHANSSNPAIEWKYSFAIAEKFLCSKAMTNAARFCFRLLMILLAFVFQETDIITNEHVKSIFFFTCEELPKEKFLNEPWQCILHMIWKLEFTLENKCLPDYFIKENNLIELISPDILSWHVEKLVTLERHFMEHLHFFLEHNNLKDLWSLEKCFDNLLVDSQKFVCHKTVENTYRECFYPLYLNLIRDIGMSGKFDMAEQVGARVFQEVRKFQLQYPSDITALTQDVLNGMPVWDQWLFAFYLDTVRGHNFLEHVCHPLSCIEIQTLFGQRFLNALESDDISLQTLSIPTVVAYQENIVKFAQQFGEILIEFLDAKHAFVAAMHHFLKQNTHGLLVTISNERIEGVNYTTHKATLSTLEILFSDTYRNYKALEQIHEFNDLLDLYDELCGFLDKAECYQWVADQWVLIGNVEKAQLARMKANSLQRNGFHEDEWSTRV